MSKSSVAKRLLPKVPDSRAPAAGRSTPPPPSARWSTSPRSCSPSTGYAATSLDAIVAGAAGHQGRALPPLQRQAGAVRGGLRAGRGGRRRASIQQALKGTRTRGRRRAPGCGRSSAVVQEPRYRRIVIQEGPAVLGYERFREQEERSTFANVLDIVRAVLERRRVGARRGRCCRPSPGSSSARCPRPASRSRAPRTPRPPPPGGDGDRLHPAGLPVPGRRGRRAADR